MDKMTEQMAIKELEDYIDLPFGVSISDETCKIAIQALEEIQQYRAIGTVKEIKIRQAEFAVLSERYLNDLTSLREYQSIGTMEELQALKEKSYTTTEPHMERDEEIDVYCCPSCGSHVGIVEENENFEQSYCPTCGQHLD